MIVDTFMASMWRMWYFLPGMFTMSRQMRTIQTVTGSLTSMSLSLVRCLLCLAIDAGQCGVTSDHVGQ